MKTPLNRTEPLFSHFWPLLAGLFSLTLLSGCAVDGSRINLAKMYDWEEGNNAAFSTRRESPRPALDSLSYPDPSPSDPSFFPLTMASLSLGTFDEEEASDRDYV